MTAEERAVEGPVPLALGELREIAEQITAEFEAATAPPPATLDVAVLDPFRLRVRWMTPPERRATVQENLGAKAPTAPLVLRFHRCGNGHAVPPYDVFLTSESGERAFDFRRGGVTYRIELGLLRTDGSVATIAEAGPVQTPPASPSPRRDVTLVEVRREGGAIAARDRSAEPAAQRLSTQLFTEDALPRTVTDDPKSVSASEVFHADNRANASDADARGAAIAWP